LKTKPTDVALIAVASNNLMTINKDQVRHEAGFSTVSRKMNYSRPLL
jgi:hypothetical protein